MVNQYRKRAQEFSQHKTEQAIKRARKVNPAAAKELERYQEQLGARVKVKTMENYTTHLSKLIAGSHNRTGKVTTKGLKKPISQLTNDDIRAYWKRIDHLTNSSKYATWAALRSFCCDHLKYDRQMDDALTSRWERLMDNIKKPRLGKRLLTQSDLITPELVDQLLAACRNRRDKAFFSVLFDSGARLGEVLGMEVRDINLESQPCEVKIRVSKTEDHGGRRPVYLLRAEPLLKAWLEAHPWNDGTPAFYKSDTPVWVTTIGKERQVLSPATARRIFELVKERAGIPKQRLLFAHLFRHSRASELHDVYGLDVKEIKELLGHSRLETTDGYLTLNRSVMIAKLQGQKDTKLEERRQKAIEQGQPVICACGVKNDPQSAFCYRCSRVIDAGVARELVRKRETESKTMEAQMDHLREHIAAVEDLAKDTLAREHASVVAAVVADLKAQGMIKVN